jgi:hypothetical protein
MGRAGMQPLVGRPWDAALVRCPYVEVDPPPPGAGAGPASSLVVPSGP